MKPGRKPYGYYRDEQAIVEIIKLKMRTRKGGRKAGPYTIAKELNKEHYKPPAGGTWTGQTVTNIIKRIKKEPKKREKRITKTRLGPHDYMNFEELEHCRAILRQSEKVIFETLLATGLRAAEFCDLKIKDIAVEHGKSQVAVRCGKGNKGRSVDIDDDLAELLSGYITKIRPFRRVYDALFYNKMGKPIKYNDLYYLIKTIGNRSGLKWLTPHKFRHTFGTILYHDKKNLIYVRDQMGHSSVKTTEIYINTIFRTDENPMAGFAKLIHPKRREVKTQSNCKSRKDKKI